MVCVSPLTCTKPLWGWFAFAFRRVSYRNRVMNFVIKFPKGFGQSNVAQNTACGPIGICSCVSTFTVICNGGLRNVPIMPDGVRMLNLIRNYLTTVPPAALQPTLFILEAKENLLSAIPRPNSGILPILDYLQLSVCLAEPMFVYLCYKGFYYYFLLTHINLCVCRKLG